MPYSPGLRRSPRGPRANGVRCGKTANARAPWVQVRENGQRPRVQVRENGERPCAIPLPSTNGAHNPSLGYSPRKRDIETIQGLKARHHPVDSRGRDMSGLQPFGSIIMADTQAVGPPRCLLSNAFAPCKPNLLRARTTTGISPESDATTLS